MSADGADPLQALVSVMEDCFELSEHDVQRNRVLVAEQGLLSRRSNSPREEEARQAARSRTRDLEFAWASFLSHAMAQGTIPRATRLLTRAILGLYNSVWHWYRPNGIVTLSSVAAFFTDRCLALIGVPPEATGRAGGGGVTFFERYFARPRRTGPAPPSSWSPTTSSSRSSGPTAATAPAASSSAASRTCTRSSTPATCATGPTTCCLAAPPADVEFASARTRYDSGERIGTFLAVAQLDADGRMARYMVARSPAIAFESVCGSMPGRLTSSPSRTA